MSFDELYFRGAVSGDLLLQQRHVPCPPDSAVKSDSVVLVLNLPFCSESVRADLSDKHRAALLESNALPSVSAEVSRKSLLIEKPKKNDELKVVRKSVDEMEKKPKRASAEETERKRSESVGSKVKRDSDRNGEDSVSKSKTSKSRLALSSHPSSAPTIVVPQSPKSTEGDSESGSTKKRLFLSSQPSAGSPESGMKPIKSSANTGDESPHLKSMLHSRSEVLSTSMEDSSDERANVAIRASVFQSMVAAKSNSHEDSSDTNDMESEQLDSDSVDLNLDFWDVARKRWSSKLQLAFSQAAISGALNATAEARNQRRKAVSYLSSLGKYFRKKGRTRIPLTEAMKTLAVTNHVLFFDPEVLRDSSSRPVLLMQPAKCVLRNVFFLFFEIVLLTRM